MNKEYMINIFIFNTELYIFHTKDEILACF